MAQGVEDVAEHEQNKDGPCCRGQPVQRSLRSGCHSSAYTGSRVDALHGTADCAARPATGLRSSARSDGAQPLATRRGVWTPAQRPAPSRMPGTGRGPESRRCDGAGSTTAYKPWVVGEAGQVRSVDRAGVEQLRGCRRVGINRQTGTRWRFGRTVLSTAGGAVHCPSFPDSTRCRPRQPRYLSVADRTVIADLRRTDATVRVLAAEIGRSPSTVSRELRRYAQPSGPLQADTLRPGPGATRPCTGPV